MSGERLGIAVALRDRRMSFADRHPSLARFFLGRGPDYEHKPRLVRTAPVDRAYRNMPSIEAIMAAQSPPVIVVPEIGATPFIDGRGVKRRRLRDNYASAVTQIVCQVWGVKFTRLMSPERTRQVAYTRNAAWMIIRDRCGVSLPEIAKYYDRDHSTVIHGLRVATRLYAEDPEWRANYDHAVALIDEAALGNAK